MLEYDRIDVYEGIDVNKTDGLRECIVCHQWYFSEINLRFAPKLCNSCDDIIQKALCFNNVAIASVKGNNYRIHFWYVSKEENMNLLKNAVFTVIIILHNFQGFGWSN